MNNLIPADQQLTHDFRPRFNEAEAKNIEQLAQMYGIKKNVFARLLIKKGLATLNDADLFTILAERTN